MKKYSILILLIMITNQCFALDGLFVKTIDYTFKERWNNTISTTTPTISTTDTVYKRQYFFLTAITWDFASDSQDMSNVQYSIKIIKPDNSLYFSQENLPIINRKISNKKNFQMSDAIIKISFEENDSFGIYKIEVKIKDNVSGKSKTIDSDIHLVELPLYDKLKVIDDKVFMKWLERYYENPNPETALAYYIYYAESELSENESNFLNIFSFFLEIFKNNQFLLPHLTSCYQTQNLKTKIYLIYLMHYSQVVNTDFFSRLNESEKEAYLKIKESALPDIHAKIEKPNQLDMLWATFMAGGSYQPILKLIQTLDYSIYQGGIDEFKNTEQNDEEKQKAIKNAIYNSLVWSLESNCHQHKLVLEYCNWAIKYEKLSSLQKNELQNILNEF